MDLAAASGGENVRTFAQMIADYGVTVVISAIVLAGLAAMTWIAIGYFRRKLSDSYIPQEQVVEWVKTHRAELLRPAAEDRPTLLNHPYFNECTRVIRAAETACDASKLPHPAPLIQRDILVLTVRTYRDSVHDFVQDAYNSKAGLDDHIGPGDQLRNEFDNLLVEAGADVRGLLVEDYGLTPAIHATWAEFYSDFHLVLQEGVIAACNRDAPYERLHTVLDLLHQHVLLLPLLVGVFAQQHSGLLAGSKYDPPMNTTDHTLRPNRSRRNRR